MLAGGKGWLTAYFERAFPGEQKVSRHIFTDEHPDCGFSTKLEL